MSASYGKDHARVKKKKSRPQPKKKDEARRSAPPALSRAKGPAATPLPAPASGVPDPVSVAKMFPKTSPSVSVKVGEPGEDSGLHHPEFFAPPPPPKVPHGLGIDDDLDEPKLRVFSEAAKERRKKNVRVVKWFVGGCLALTAIAGIRHAFRTEEPLPVPPSTSAATTGTASSEPPSYTAPSTSANVAADTDAAPLNAGTAGDASAVTTSTDDAGVAPSTLGTPDAAPALTAYVPSPEDATKERDRAKRALESGRLKEAVVAGERSVSLDPTDADAWLYLGAAYQEQGDQGNANRCYRACLAQGTHGNKSECAAMMK